MDARSLVAGNWRTNAERAILDRNYVLYILLGQGQRSETRFPCTPWPVGLLFQIDVESEARKPLPIRFIVVGIEHDERHARLESEQRHWEVGHVGRVG
jgi:hypothetical protein